MQFKDRAEAARQLLKELMSYKGQNPLVLGIPRGAVPMASIIAKGLEGELGVVLVHKIPSPSNEEFAIGSIGLSGHIQKLPYADAYGISESYLQEEAALQLEHLKARQKQYGLKELDYRDRVVIIVDDGIATGATTLSAIHEVLYHQPKKVVLAAAVSPIDSAQRLRAVVDEAVILYEPVDFYAVGQFFVDFDQVSDDEVIELLREFKK
jgi:putative phosphoribosyl transferase